MIDAKFEKEYLKQVSRQLEMNELTWQRLMKHGIIKDTILQPNFVFISHNEKDAFELKNYLEENNCVNVKIVKKGLVKKIFEVQGQSLPTELSKNLTQEWIRWLVIQGIKFNSSFDGWSVLLPEAKI